MLLLDSAGRQGTPNLFFPSERGILLMNRGKHYNFLGNEYKKELSLTKQNYCSPERQTVLAQVLPYSDIFF